MHTYTVEFRIEGESLVPAELTEALGLQPCQVREPSGPGETRVQIKALWAYDGFGAERESKHEWESLEVGLLFLLEKLLPKQSQIQRISEKFDAYWWCGHFQQSFDGGPVFSSEVLRKLADLGAPLMLDNYFSVNDEKASGMK